MATRTLHPAKIDAVLILQTASSAPPPVQEASEHAVIVFNLWRWNEKIGTVLFATSVWFHCKQQLMSYITPGKWVLRPTIRADEAQSLGERQWGQGR